MAAVNGRDLDIANRLRLFGVRVIEVAGWQTRGRATLQGRGSVDHHTASNPNSGNAPSLGICINGRSDLPGPLCNVLGSRDMIAYVIASGKANHAGTGGWKGLSGNSSVYGFEHEHAGTSAEKWTEERRDFDARVHAALIHGSTNASMVCEHKEWTPRKPDKYDTDGNDTRRRVQHYLDNPPWMEVEVPDPAITYHKGSRYVFVKGVDNKLWMKRDKEDWTKLGGILTSGPDAASDGTNLTVVVRGQDGGSWALTSQDGVTWGDWVNEGGKS